MFTFSIGHQNLIENPQHYPGRKSNVVQIGVGECNFNYYYPNTDNKQNHHIWNSPSCEGLLIGYVRNMTELSDVWEDLPSRVLQNPGEILSKISGSFTFVAICEDSAIISTDLLGTIPVYYTKDGLYAASNAGILSRKINTPKINAEAISDLILYSAVQGQATLIEEINVVPPGSYVKYNLRKESLSCEYSITVNRYSWLNFDQSNTKDVDLFYETFDQILGKDLEDLGKHRELGLWLSGGLDSRLIVDLTKNHLEKFSLITYDANPGNGENISIASKIARHLELNHIIPDISEDSFTACIEEGVQRVDGRCNLIDFHGLPYIMGDLTDDIDIIIETPGQGELFGENITNEEIRKLDQGHSVLDVYLNSFSNLASRNVVQNIFSKPLIKHKTLQTEVEVMPHNDSTELLLELFHQSFYPNSHYRPKLSLHNPDIEIMTPLNDFNLLNLSANMSSSLRRNSKSLHTLNFSSQPVSPLKMLLIRQTGRNLSSFNYDRTSLPPKLPLILHTYMNVTKTLIRTMRSKIGNKNPKWNQPYDTWYMSNSNFTKTLDKFLNSAAQRELYKTSAIQRIRDGYISGKKGNLRIMCAIVTAEIWLNNNTDL